MNKQHIAVLLQDDINSLELINNKITCAEQAANPNSLPAAIAGAEAMTFFRESLFSLADARFLEESCWRNIAIKYGIKLEDISKLYIDFDSNELWLNQE